MTSPNETSAPIASASEDFGPVDPKRWLALTVVLVAAFMDLLDVTIVNVAIPSIQRDLNAGYSEIQWVAAGYALAFAAGLITGGRLGDIYGRKLVFVIGMSGFTVASALSGLATDPQFLIGARIFQGAMAALMVPQILAIIHVSFPKEERGKVFGMYGGIAGSATVFGPILGGLLVQYDIFGWHWRPIFLVNIPVGILGVFAALVYIRESKSEKALRLDLIGMALVTIGVLLLVYPLTEGRDLGWPGWTFAMLGGAAVVLIAFVLYSRTVNNRGGSPLLPLTLFSARSFASGFSVNLVFNLATGSFFLMWTLYMQEGLGWTPLHAGLSGIPWSLGLAIAAGLSVQYLAPALGKYTLIIGGVLLALGALLFIGTAARYTDLIHSWEMIPALFVMGLGVGLVVAPLMDFALTDVPHESAGSASGAINMTWQLGTTVGIAIVGVIFLSPLGGQAGHAVDTLTPQISRQLTAAGVPDALDAPILAAYKQCAQDRASETDPTVTPASCKQAPPSELPQATASKIEQILEGNAAAVDAKAFSRAFQIGLIYVIGLVLATTAMMLALPKKAKPQEL
ncbi:MAG TPA: MFS transporter [Actinospica sp.]|nr:MFS transporter [Actinospica sp.]